MSLVWVGFWFSRKVTVVGLWGVVFWLYVGSVCVCVSGVGELLVFLFVR